MFVFQLLQKHPKDRLSLDDILNHPWVTENVDVEFVVRQVEDQMSQPKLSYDTSINDDTSGFLSTIEEIESTLGDDDQDSSSLVDDGPGSDSTGP